MKHKLVIGLDPDIDASGVAVWSRETNSFASIFKCPIEDIFEFFQEFSTVDTIIYVEAGWKNDKANFRRGRKSAVSEKISMHVGMNHAASKISARILKKMGFEFVETAPLRKGFMKDNNGWTPLGREYFYKLTGLQKKISDDQKDACLLAFTFR